LQAASGIYTRTDDRASFIASKVNSIAQQQKPQFDCGFELKNFGLPEEESEATGLYSSELAIINSRQNPANCQIPKQILTFAGYPLIVEERLVGVMVIISRQPLTAPFQETLA
jgi:GAF domain-containing protein